MSTPKKSELDVTTLSPAQIEQAFKIHIKTIGDAKSLEQAAKATRVEEVLITHPWLEGKVATVTVEIGGDKMTTVASLRSFSPNKSGERKIGWYVADKFTSLGANGKGMTHEYRIPITIRGSGTW